MSISGDEGNGSRRGYLLRPTAERDRPPVVSWPGAAPHPQQHRQERLGDPFIEDQTRIGPWLLFDSFEEIVDKVLRWGHVSDEVIVEARYDLMRWSATSVAMHLTDAKRRDRRRARLAVDQLRA